MAASLSSATQPWTARKDWARGEVKSSDWKNLLVTWFFTLFWNGVSWPIAFVLAKRPPKESLAYLGFVFPFIGLILVIVAVRATMRFFKFGTSTFKMLAVPGAVGGHLSGVIETNAKLHPEGGFHLSLRCVRMETTGSGKNRRTVEVLLWEDYKTLRSEMLTHDNRRSGVPVFFEIPADVPETNKEEQVLWRLALKAEVPGIDYEARFEVPVFRVAEIQQSSINPAEFAARFESPAAAPEAKLPRMGVEVEELRGMGTRIYFRRSRNLSPTLNTIVFFLIMGAVAYGLWQLNGVVPKVFGTFAGLFALLFLWGVGECVAKSVEVIAGKDGLRIRTDRGYSASDRFLSAKDIERITAHSSLQIGETRYYEIRVRARRETGLRVQNFVAGSGIKGRKEAEWIVAKLISALNISQKHEAAQTPQD